MVERLKDDLLTAIRERLAAKGITPETSFDGLPVGGVCDELIPYVGSVYLPAGRIVPRRESDKRFKKLRR